MSSEYEHTSALPATVVHLRHQEEELWWGGNGEWLERREEAVRFGSNIDALRFCRSAGVSGILVGFNARGREVYQLIVDELLNRLREPNGKTAEDEPSRPT